MSTDDENRGARTTLELIQELDDEASQILDADARLEFCALIVEFESSTSFVFPTDDDRLKTLNRLIEAGGMPVGFIRIIQQKGKMMIATRSLQESAYDDAKDYLDGLAASVVDQVERKKAKAEKIEGAPDIGSRLILEDLYQTAIEKRQAVIEPDVLADEAYAQLDPKREAPFEVRELALAYLGRLARDVCKERENG